MAAKSKLAVNASLITDNKKDAFWRVCHTDSQGVSTTKVISQETFVNLLKANTIVRKESTKNRLGKMPYGYVDCLYGKPDEYTIAVCYPAKKRGVVYYNDTYFVPNPNLLFIFKINNGIVAEKRCFAVKTTEITATTPLYQFPFGNVSEAWGSMCYGNIKLPSCIDFSTIDELVQLFLNGQVNDDLYRKEFTTKNCKQFELLKFLSNKKSFPEKILKEATYIGKPLLFEQVFLEKK